MIRHLEKQTGIQGQATEQHPFPSPLISNTPRSVRLLLTFKKSARLPTYEKLPGLDQQLSRKRKRSQEAEDLAPQTTDQPVDAKRKIPTNENEEHQLLSPSTSNSHKQLSGKKRRAVSRKPPLQESNNRYSKRRKALRQISQTVQFQETVPEANNYILQRPEEEPKALESKEKKKDDPISYWAANHTWPDNFAESGAMSSNNTNKRPRRSDHSQSGKDEKTPSYSQSRKDGDVPEQYTKSYEKYIFTQGLDMDSIKGRDLVSPDSKATCKELQEIACVGIAPTVYSEAETLEVINLCRNRNEAMVNRDITPLIVPPIKSLYLKDGRENFQYLTDEVNTQWYESWVLAGPRPKPDLAVGFLSTSFTIEETQKLTNYTSFDNLTRPTDELSFPFLMCEVKCGNEGLDYADRQNMHSCSVAIKALLKLEQKADQYREDGEQFESLLGKILVYSISHDQKNARVYGHFALAEGEKWSYHRHFINSFDIANKERDLLALHNFARNVLTKYAPKLLERIQNAIAALPVSSTLSFYAGTMSLEDNWQQGSQKLSQDRDGERFTTPDLPASTQRLFDAQKEQMDKLLQQLEQQRQESKKQMEQQTNKFLQQLEQQRQESKEQMERQVNELKSEKDDQKEQIKELMHVLKRQVANK